MVDELNESLLALTADIVAAHVSSNSVGITDLPVLIANVHAALSGLGEVSPAAEPERVPAVSVRASVKPDHIVCLEDGKKFKTLKRHLATDHGLSVADYRARWNLPVAYPMVAPNYAETRRALAARIGLGRRKAAPVATDAPALAGTRPRKPRGAAPVPTPPAEAAAHVAPAGKAATAAPPGSAARKPRAKLGVWRNPDHRD